MQGSILLLRFIESRAVSVTCRKCVIAGGLQVRRLARQRRCIRCRAGLQPSGSPAGPRLMIRYLLAVVGVCTVPDKWDARPIIAAGWLRHLQGALQHSIISLLLHGMCLGDVFTDELHPEQCTMRPFDMHAHAPLSRAQFQQWGTSVQ